MAWDRLRTVKWLLISGVVSVGVTAILWTQFGPKALFAFLFLPFFPFAFGSGMRLAEETPKPRSCARCGFTSDDARNRFCPRDGDALV